MIVFIQSPDAGKPVQLLEGRLTASGGGGQEGSIGTGGQGGSSGVVMLCVLTREPVTLVQWIQQYSLDLCTLPYVCYPLMKSLFKKQINMPHVYSRESAGSRDCC